MLLAGLFVINTILFYFRLDTVICSVLAAILAWLFLYISSFVFKFCLYHRMFLYYIVVVEVLNWIDYDYDLFKTDDKAVAINVIIAGIFLFIILALKINHERCVKKTNCSRGKKSS